MRQAIGLWILLVVAIYIVVELIRAQHPSLPWIKRRRTRRIRWQWARRPVGADGDPDPTPSPAPQP